MLWLRMFGGQSKPSNSKITVSGGAKEMSRKNWLVLVAFVVAAAVATRQAEAGWRHHGSSGGSSGGSWGSSGGSSGGSWGFEWWFVGR